MITSDTSSTTLNGNGVTTAFPFTFKVFSVAQLQAWILAADGTSTQTTDFSAVLTDTGGTVTYPVIGVTKLPTGAKITILRAMAFTQETDLVNGNEFRAEVIETALDTLTMETLELKEGMDRAVKVPAGSAIDPDDYLNTIIADTAMATAQAALAVASRAAADADVVLTHADAAQTALDRIAVAADKGTVAADKATVAADKATVAADKATVAADKATTSGYKDSAAASAGTATTQAGIATTKASDSDTARGLAVVAQLAAEAALASTLTAYDNFDDRYLGAKAADPTVDNDGNALVAGALYFNTVSAGMKVYTGSAWVAAYISGSGYLAAANNLSDLGAASTARTNLGLGTAATIDAGTSAGNVLLLASNAKLPALDGSLLTGIATGGSSPYVSGLFLSLDTDTEHDIDVAAGSVLDSTGATTLTLAAHMTKRIDTAWGAGDDGGGLDTGSVGNSTYYYLWLISTAAGADVDVLFSASATAPTMPATYTLKACIGRVRTNSSANIDPLKIISANPLVKNAEVWLASNSGGNFIMPPWTQDAIVEVQAAGGGAGSTASGATNCAGAGGGGGYGLKVVRQAPLTSTAVTVGAGGTGAGGGAAGNAGGTSSFGALVSCTGGAGGGASGGLFSAGGAGGAATGADLAIPGGPGGSTYASLYNATTPMGVAGAGGGSAMSPGGTPQLTYAAGNVAGTAGKAYGGGADGCFTLSTDAITGQTGAVGIVIVEI